MNAVQGEHSFKRVFRRTRTQGDTLTMMCRSHRISPHKEVTMQRRKMKLNEDAEESEEIVPRSPTLLENIEEQFEESKERGEGEKGPYETTA